MNPLAGLDRRIIAAACVAAALFGTSVVGCSLPPDERVSRIDVDELGELANTTTTTTTTVPPTTLPTTTEPGATSTTTTSTTTIANLATLPQRLYYTLGNTDDLQEVMLPLSDSATYATLRGELESPRPEVREQRLATAVRPLLIAGFDFDPTDVTLTIALDGDIFDSLTETQRRRAIGQMVLTYTSFVPRDTGAVGFVNFTVDGEPISVPIPPSGSFSDEGQPLTFADFRSLLEPASQPTDTAPTTAPPTSVPDGPSTATTAP